MAYIYSTLSADQSFNVWTNTKDPRMLPKRQGVILINGKANIANKKTLDTPKGVVTQVTDAELAELKKIGQFNRMVERGFLTVEAKEAKSADDVAKNMTAKDKSAQKTKKDMEDSSEKASAKVSTNKK